MKAQLPGKTRSALMLLMFVTAQAHFSALTQPRTGRPAPHVGRELCEATPLEGCRRGLCRRSPVDDEADRLAVTEWIWHRREHDGIVALYSRR
jgi:hypothetical protein